MNDEVKKSKSIKIKPSLVCEAYHKAIESGKTLGRRIEIYQERRGSILMRYNLARVAELEPPEIF